MQNLDWQYIGQIIGGDFAKLCGLLRIYELYKVLQRKKRNMGFPRKFHSGASEGDKCRDKMGEAGGRGIKLCS